MRRAMDERIATAGKALTRLAAERATCSASGICSGSPSRRSRGSPRACGWSSSRPARTTRSYSPRRSPPRCRSRRKSPTIRRRRRRSRAFARTSPWRPVEDARAEAAALKAKLEEAEEDAARHSSRAALGALPYEAETRALPSGAGRRNRRQIDPSPKSPWRARRTNGLDRRRPIAPRFASSRGGTTTPWRRWRRVGTTTRRRRGRGAPEGARGGERVASRELRDSKAAAARARAAAEAARARAASLEEAARGRDARASMRRWASSDALRAELEAEKAKRREERSGGGDGVGCARELVAARHTQILPDLAALDEMESRLHSLAGTLRAREREVASLNGTVEAQVMERRALAEELRGARDRRRRSRRRWRRSGSFGGARPGGRRTRERTGAGRTGR